MAVIYTSTMLVLLVVPCLYTILADILRSLFTVSTHHRKLRRDGKATPSTAK